MITILYNISQRGGGGRPPLSSPTESAPGLKEEIRYQIAKIDGDICRGQILNFVKKNHARRLRRSRKISIEEFINFEPLTLVK